MSNTNIAGPLTKKKREFDYFLSALFVLCVRLRGMDFV